LLTINLSPATLPKAGSHYDLAIVAAVLAAQGVFGAEELRRTALLGELGLDGRVRPVRSVLPATLAAQQAGLTRVIVPLRQAGEAQLVEGIEVFGIASITQLVAFLGGDSMPLVEAVEVMGEEAGKQASKPVSRRAAAWTWQMWLVRSRLSGLARWPQRVAITCSFMARPGVGKTMLAERVPGVLPDLDVSRRP
jgi:magnesium chelatase family protein